jgi:hypothetical protein
MEMCYLRGDCRPGDFGKPTIDKNGKSAKHKKQEKVKGLIRASLLIPKNIIWPFALFAKEMKNYPRTLMVSIFAFDVEALDSLEKKRKCLRR